MKDDGVLYPQVDPEVWAQQYGLEIKSIVCSKCGNPQLLNIPIAFRNKRGLSSALHDCGPRYQSYTVTTICPKERELYLKVFKLLSGE